MLRAVLLILLLANALFFAWTRGWLASAWPPPGHGEREPERRAAQVRPDSVVVVAPQAAGSAAGARPVCLEAGPLSDDETGPAIAALGAAGVPESRWTRDVVERPGTWAVYFGRFTDAAEQRAREEELARLQVTPQPVTSPAELAPGLMLTPHDQRQAADTELALLAQRGVRNAQVVALPPPPLQHWLRVHQADADLQARLLALKTPALAGVPGAGFIACAKAP